MKFTKDELSEALRAKLTNKGKKNLSMSTRTFNGMVEKIFKRLEKRESEDELDDIVTDYIEDFEEVEGDFRKRDSEHAKKVKELEEKPSKPKEEKETESEEDVPAWAKKLIEDNKKLHEKVTGYEEARAVKEKRKELYRILEKKGVSKEYLDDYDDAIQVTSNTDIDELAEKWEKRYNRHKSSDTTGYTPGASGGSGGDDKDDFADIVAIRKRTMHIDDNQ
ncbi:MAG: hypothetical protein HUK08_05335 [Bacteroidaceae bacterium]|nr:hypothetical protein [Bacteroidaceae bacterium]